MKQYATVKLILEYMENHIKNAPESPTPCKMIDIVDYLSTQGIDTNLTTVSRYLTWITRNTHIKCRRRFPHSIDSTKEYWIDDV